MYKVAVIAPVYNVEDYLEKSIKSILMQSLKEIEVILVNDGSTDNSGNICDELADIDSRITVIHKKNSGAADSRNEGIKKSNAEYLYFLDPDDWCDEFLLESLYREAERTKSELVIQGFINEYAIDGEYFQVPQSAESFVMADKLSVRENIYKYFNNTLIAVPWNKLYKSDYIKENRLEFPNVKWDDLHFNMEVLRNINKVAVSSEMHYHFFRTRPGSETTKVFDTSLFDKRKEQFKHILDIYNYWEQDDVNSIEAINYYFCGRAFQCIQEISSVHESKKNKKSKINKILNDDMLKVSLEKQNGPSKLMSFFLYLMEKQRVQTLIIFGNSISFIKNRFVKTFYKVRRNYLIKGES